MDTASYDSLKEESLRSGNIESINWVSDEVEDTVLYRKAFKAMSQGKGTFQQCLLKSEYVKHAI